MSWEGEIVPECFYWLVIAIVYAVNDCVILFTVWVNVVLYMLRGVVGEYSSNVGED